MRMFAQGFERDRRVDAPLEADVDAVPPRFLRIALGIVVGILRIERGGLGITCAYHADDARDARLIAARVIEKAEIALLHVVPQHVSRLVVAHAVPSGGGVSGAREVIDAEGRGFGLEEPVLHCVHSVRRSDPRFGRNTPRSVTTRSSGTSQGAAAIVPVSWQAKATPTIRGRRHAPVPASRRRSARS